MPGAVGSAGVATLRPPRSTNRMALVGSLAWTSEDFASDGNNIAIPFPSRPWQAEH
jgi:hypothetical protein